LYEFSRSGAHLRTLDALTGVVLLSFGHVAEGRLSVIDDRDGLRTQINRSAGLPASIESPFGVTTTLGITDGYLTSVTDPEGAVNAMAYTGSGLLTSRTDANGGVHTFGYNAIGRLSQDQGPAGGDQTLHRVDTLNGWEIVRSIADAGATVYGTRQIEVGGQQRTVTGPDGTVTETVNDGRGTTTTLAADGTRTTVTLAPDPRFGVAELISRAGGTAVSVPFTAYGFRPLRPY
jgi:YD repeat-containing protein